MLRGIVTLAVVLSICNAWALKVGIADLCNGSKAEVQMEGAYARAFAACGHEVRIVTDAAGVTGLDLLVFPGGEDVDPKYYGAERSAKLEAVNERRDLFERGLFKAAVEDGLPILGICRGVQHMNVYFGGTLYQDLPSEVGGSVNHRPGKEFEKAKRGACHAVKVETDSRLRGLMGGAEFMVNSTHHQALKDIAPGFKVVARAEDGVVEAVECENFPAAGVQFHPEKLVTLFDNAEWKALFKDPLAFTGKRAVVASGGAAKAAIVSAPGASAQEKCAARELAAALEKITGAKFAVTEKDPGAGVRFVVGGDPLKCAPWKYDEVFVARRGDVLYLTGDAVRGALYAVDVFLENYLGVRWWTKDEADYPQKSELSLPSFKDLRYAPPFRYRETFYQGPLCNADFKVRMKSNCSSFTRYIIPPTKEEFVPAEKGGNHKLVFFKGRRSAYHSFFEVLPPAKYFKEHPEWYSLIKGSRSTKGQLCTTNEEMFKEYVKETLRLLRESPDCDSIQVTQNDHFGPCECEACRAVLEREGAYSGAYIDFANRVAAEVEKVFPNVMIDTFAYQFTRQAPKSVRPRKNVLVRLCDIECAFNRSLENSPESYKNNHSFMRDLIAWSKVAAGNLYIWDYQANFTSYILPHPNLHVFSDNIKTFAKYGAVGIFEQGDAMCPVGDFVPLKQWVTAHLVWDPSRDWRGLRDEFLTGYYGSAAAPYLRAALEAVERSVTREGVPEMGCYHENIRKWISEEDAKAAMAAVAEAERAAVAQGEVYARRVRGAALAWEHARIINWGDWGGGADKHAAAEKWVNDLRSFGVNSYRETTSAKTFEDYVNKLLKVE